MGKQVEPDADASAEGEIGPENAPASLRRRGCTDVFCLVFFVAFMLGMLYLTFLAWTYGEPYSILYSKDYLGNRCGVGDFKNRSKTVFPRIDRDLLEQSAVAAATPWKVVLYGLCVPSCPNVTDPTRCFGASIEECMVHDYGSAEDQRKAGGRAVWFTVLPTIDVLNRCVPTKHVTADAAPDRCAYPSCDNVTNPWMQCDAEFPALWTIRSLGERAKCKVKFQSVQVDQLATTEPSPLVERLAEKAAFLSRLIQSLVAAQTEIMVLGLVAPALLGLAWLILLRLFARTVVWLAVLAVGILMGCLSLYLFLTSGALEAVLDELAGNRTGFGFLANASSAISDVRARANAQIVQVAPDELTQASQEAGTSNPFLYQVGAWVSGLLFILYMLAMCVFRKKVSTAAALVKESTVVIKDRPHAIGFPFVVLAAQVPIVLYFVFGMSLIGTANLEFAHFVGGAQSLITASSSYADALNVTVGLNLTAAEIPAQYEKWLPAAIYIYFLFGVLWTLESLKNVGWTAMSGNVSDWYFFRRDEKKRSRLPLLSSLLRVLRYHLGTIFFGSFIIAFIQLIRILMAVLDSQTKKLQEQNQARPCSHPPRTTTAAIPARCHPRPLPSPPAAIPTATPLPSPPAKRMMPDATLT
jgi:choline transporter-like protein 2/4/5